MDSFEFNKIAASVLIALLIAMVGSVLSEHLIHPARLAKPVLVVEGVEESPSGTGKEEPLKPIAGLLASASVERGQVVAKKCAQCHTFEKGQPHRIGPNLWGIIGAKIAHAADFAYSTGFKTKGGQWDYENLNHYLHKPRSFIKDTKMSFPGLQSDQDRADILVYLRTLSDSPAPLPSKPEPEASLHKPTIEPSLAKPASSPDKPEPKPLPKNKEDKLR
jgi:cytochrome c